MHWPTVLDLHGKVLVARGYRGGFCEKLLEASPMSDRANASRLQDGPAAGQGQANQRWWQRLCDNIFKKKKIKSIRALFAARERSDNSADTKVSEEGGGGGAPGTRAEILLQPEEQTTVRQAVP